MTEPLSLRLERSQRQDLKQTQRLMMLPQMQQALMLLQLPIMELATMIESEIEQNPLLDTDEEREPFSEVDEDEQLQPSEDQEVSFEETNFEILRLLDDEFREHLTQTEFVGRRRSAEEDKRKAFLDSLVVEQESLLDHLTTQARETFDEPEELEAADLLIGYIDSSGYMTTPTKEISALHGIPKALLDRVLQQIQAFDPVGVGAGDAREALLIQLRTRKKQQTLAYAIVKHHWDDLVHHRIPSMARSLGCSNAIITRVISDEIATLDLRPGATYSKSVTQPIVPDVMINNEEEGLVVTVNEAPMPTFHLNQRYLKLLQDPAVSEETKDFLRQKLGSAKWLLKTIDQRNSTLHRIADYLIKTQALFFTIPNGKLKPLTMKTVADELSVHESTIARAVANKYLYCPRGLLSLRSFFTNTYVTQEGQDISSKTVREALERLIKGENKSKPLSDHALSRLLKAQGIACARRTVAKYRNALQIGNALQRRVYE